MIVYEKKDINEGCSTCLYKGSNGLHCAHADNHGAIMLLVNGGKPCGSYWLDQNRFQRTNDFMHYVR